MPGGDDSLETARKREEIVDRLCDTLANEGWNFIRDKSNKTTKIPPCSAVAAFTVRPAINFRKFLVSWHSLLARSTCRRISAIKRFQLRHSAAYATDLFAESVISAPCEAI